MDASRRNRSNTLSSEEADPGPTTLRERFQTVRRFTHDLCAPLETEDYVIQTMEDVSPTKWHLAHTSWFFETFVLAPTSPDYKSPHPKYAYLFNSYYNAVGDRHARPQRGFISRPTVEDVFAYRSHVDDHMQSLLGDIDGDTFDRLAPIIEIGMHHEQQHQELMLTDIKHVLAQNPLRPSYHRRAMLDVPGGDATALSWKSFPEGVYAIGHAGDGFAYDNEGPRHRVFLEPFRLGSRLVTNHEYLEFIEDGGYERPELWLSAGWATVQELGWKAPLYWERREGDWAVFTLAGMREIAGAEPVTHLSYFEADAFARWAGCRLPTEAEWEVASHDVPITGNFADNGRFHPVAANDTAGDGGLLQVFGDVWEWTQSHYSPYPGYTPPAGAIGEYNGKFMCNQFVLRGGSCATTNNHIRRTYRNFFPADARWQFSGFRLAKDGNG